MIPTREEIEATIDASIRKALQREVGVITPETSLPGDLGVDSLDFVEVVYGVEEVYDIELEPDELFPQRMLRDPKYVEEGVITADGVAKLRESFAFTELPPIRPGTPVADVANRLLTVRTFADYVSLVIRRQHGEA
jgi:acyl carrier protein